MFISSMTLIPALQSILIYNCARSFLACDIKRKSLGYVVAVTAGWLETNETHPVVVCSLLTVYF